MGESVADSLVSERNDITVIDTNAQRLRDLESRFDLRGVVGSGIEPAVLAEAGARDTDLLIACAAQDETNLVCCKIAQRLFNIPTRIARVRSSGFQDEELLMGPEGFGVDRVICPEESITRYITKLVEYPEAMQVRHFAGGRACLVAVRARVGALLVNHSISELRELLPSVDMRVVAIYRRFQDEPDRFVACDGATRVVPGDEVFVLAAHEHIAEVLSASGADAVIGSAFITTVAGVGPGAGTAGGTSAADTAKIPKNQNPAARALQRFLCFIGRGTLRRFRRIAHAVLTSARGWKDPRRRRSARGSGRP